MNSKPGSFQLEKRVPGTFLMQGFLGGVLGGFVAAIIAGIAWPDNNFVMTLDRTALAVSTGAIIGIIKATFMFGVVRLTGIKYRAIMRVTTTTILAALFTAVIGRQFNFDEKFLRGCLIWSLSVGIPVALLVGSGVKPWELFTFGSIAAGDVYQRSGSRSIPATLGTLLLRFLSITASAILALHFVSLYTRVDNFNHLMRVTLFLCVAFFYPLFSAYVTFRSPRKIVLLVLALVINFPITLVFAVAVHFYLQADGDESLSIITVVSGSFVIGWAMFLVARLGTKLSPTPSLSIISNKSIAAAPNLDHHCLGSRFVEWQQRVA